MQNDLTEPERRSKFRVYYLSTPWREEIVFMDYREISLQTAAKLAVVKIVPVLVIDTPDHGLKVCELLCSGGLPAAEITFRTPAAAMTIAAAVKEFPDMLIGAGTVLNAEDLSRSVDSGAAFAVAPGFNPAMLTAAASRCFPFAPGICTPSEIEQAGEWGCRLLKFFPAGAAGGVNFLKAAAAPYRHLNIRYMPTGGINPANAADFLSCPEVCAVGGTWIASAADIEAENWSGITANIRAAVKLISGF